MGVHNNELLNKEEVYRYICQNNDIFSSNAQLTVREIGNGNMNYVYHIKDSSSNKSIILKYAAAHTRISKDISVSTDRIRIEANMLEKQKEHVAEYVPQIYLFDEKRNCILMEDCTDFTIMRDALINFDTFPGFADHISTYLVKSLFPTTDYWLKASPKDELIKQFSNPHLCEITKTFVFTEPFNALSELNDVYEANKEYIDKEIFQDKALLLEVSKRKEAFMNNKQALLHGDLHTGSIFVNKDSLLLFDFEFAFFGPIGFDMGNLIANLIFAEIHAEGSDARGDFIDWLKETIVKIVELFKIKFKNEYNKSSDKYGDKNKGKYNDKYNDKHFYNYNDTSDSCINDYVVSIIKDAAGFAGIELIRRVVGLAHVKDITSITNESKRIRAERIALDIAKHFILNSKDFLRGEDFIQTLELATARKV